MTSYNALSEELAQQQQEYELGPRHASNYGIVWSGSASPILSEPRGITSTFGYRSIPRSGSATSTGPTGPPQHPVARPRRATSIRGLRPGGGNTVRIDHGDGLTRTAT